MIFFSEPIQNYRNIIKNGVVFTIKTGNLSLNFTDFKYEILEIDKFPD